MGPLLGLGFGRAVCEKDLPLNKTFRLLLAPNYWMHWQCSAVQLSLCDEYEWHLKYIDIWPSFLHSLCVDTVESRLVCHHWLTTLDGLECKQSALKTKVWLSFIGLITISKYSAKIIFRISLHLELGSSISYLINEFPTELSDYSTGPISVFQVRVKVNKNACS